MPPAPPWMTIITSAIASIIGGSIAGFFSLRAVGKSHKNALELQKKNQAKVIKGVLQAIHDEIETLWETYQNTMGVNTEALPDGQPLLGYYPVAHDYFTIYNGNAFLIGQIDDPDLRRMIVQCYTKAKGILDSYKLNNDMVAKYEQAVWLFNQTQNQAFNQNAIYLWQTLAAYAKKIKISHHELKDLTQQLLRRLKQMGVIAHPSNEQPLLSKRNA